MAKPFNKYMQPEDWRDIAKSVTKHALKIGYWWIIIKKSKNKD